MKVALLTDGIYPYVLGGMQKHSYYLAKYLAKNSINVLLYHTGPGDADTGKLVGFTKQELSFITSMYIPFPAISNLPGHYILESYKYSSLIFDSLIKAEGVDFIYAQGFSGWKTIREKTKGLGLPPIGVNFHGVEMFQSAPNLHAKLQHYLLRVPVKYNLTHADIAFSLGGKLTSIQEKLASKKVVEIPIGIEKAWLNKSEIRKSKKKRTFVFIGRYERRKGIEELQEVLSKLAENNEFEFYFIGPIPENKQLKRENIHYSGYVSEEAEIKKIIQLADVLVCPSYSEGMPTVVLEAMASGLAVIATDVGAVSELVKRDTGWLIPKSDTSALGAAIVEAINIPDAQLYVKKETAYNLVAHKYTWEEVIKKIILVIEERL